MVKSIRLGLLLTVVLALVPAVKSEERAQGPQVSVEIKVISLTKEIGDVLFATLAKDEQGYVRLNERQMLDFLRFALEKRENNCMAVPKMTAFSGQTATVNIVEEFSYIKSARVDGSSSGKTTVQTEKDTIPLGCKFQAETKVSPDRKYVDMNLSVYMANLVDQAPLVPVTVDGDPKYEIFIQTPKVDKIEFKKSLRAADGEVVVLPINRKQTEASKENQAPPLITKIPYLNRLFRNNAARPEATALFLFVTSHIVAD